MAARYIAKNIVAGVLQERSNYYAIGVAQPVSVRIGYLGTGTVMKVSLKAAREIFDFRP